MTCFHKTAKETTLYNFTYNYPVLRFFLFSLAVLLIHPHKVSVKKSDKQSEMHRVAWSLLYNIRSCDGLDKIADLRRFFRLVAARKGVLWILGFHWQNNDSPFYSDQAHWLVITLLVGEISKQFSSRRGSYKPSKKCHTLNLSQERCVVYCKLHQSKGIIILFLMIYIMFQGSQFLSSAW